MMQLRLANQRHRLRTGGQDVWLTFYPSVRGDSLAHGFGALLALNEGFVGPEGNMLSYSRRGSKTITYVVRGSMFLKTRTHPATLVQAGEFQCSNADLSDGSIQSNASDSEPLHVVQLSLSSLPRVLPAVAPQHRTFPPQERLGRVCLVGSVDGQGGSLALGEDVCMYSSTLAAEQTVEHPIGVHRAAWLQVLSGRICANGLELEAGDGVGFSLVPVLALRALVDAEVLLLNVSGALPHDYEKASGTRERREERGAVATAAGHFDRLSPAEPTVGSRAVRPSGIYELRSRLDAEAQSSRA